MYYNDHAPPHFHALYGSQELVVGIMPIVIMEGSSSPRTRSLVLEWAALHQQELLNNWDRCRNAQAPDAIAPLD
jgi:hypothetical protein